MSRSYKTNQGTELPILNLRGKDYLEVKYRLVWFREEHPTWSIETEFVSVTDRSACAKAVIRDEQSRIIATSHKFENQQGFPDFIEKAETGAIGRALALIGYGTQFCADELDEGARIVDSPVNRTGENDYSVHAPQGQSPGLKTDSSESPRERSGNFEIQFGKKYRGKKLKDIPREEIESYLKWLEDSAEKKNLSVPYDVKVLKKAIEIFYQDDAGSEGREASAS